MEQVAITAWQPLIPNRLRIDVPWIRRGPTTRRPVGAKNPI